MTYPLGYPLARLNTPGSTCMTRCLSATAATTVSLSWRTP